MLRYTLILILLMTSFFTGCNSSKQISLMDQMVISVKDTTRGFSYTNKKYGPRAGIMNMDFSLHIRQYASAQTPLPCAT